jgi:hypothetical protein
MLVGFQRVPGTSGLNLGPYLARRFETVSLSEHRARLPYMPLVRAPYYRFVGRRA